MRKPAITTEGRRAVIPPTERFLRLLKTSKNIDEPCIEQFLIGLAFGRADVHAAFPSLRIVNVAIFGCDVEVTEHNHFAMFQQTVAQPLLKGFQPTQFVGVFFGPGFLTIGHVQIEHHHPCGFNGEHAALFIGKLRDIGGKYRDRLPREHGDTVVGALTATREFIAERADLGRREIGVRRFGLLQRDDIGLGRAQPFGQLRQTHAQRVDVPGGDREGSHARRVAQLTAIDVSAV